MRSILLFTLLAMSSMVFAGVTPYGILEQNVVISGSKVMLDSDDSAIGVRGSKFISKDMVVKFGVEYGLKEKELDTLTGSIHSKELGILKAGSFKSFMRVESDRTINIFSANAVHRSSFYGWNRNAMAYISPIMSGFRFGVAGMVNGDVNLEERNMMEYMGSFRMKHFYISGVLRKSSGIDHKMVMGSTYVNRIMLTGGWEDNNGSDAMLVGVILPSGHRNSLRLGAKKGGGANVLSSEFNLYLSKMTSASLNLQHITSGDNIMDLIDMGDRIVTVGMRHNF